MGQVSVGLLKSIFQLKRVTALIAFCSREITAVALASSGMGPHHLREALTGNGRCHTDQLPRTNHNPRHRHRQQSSPASKVNNWGKFGWFPPTTYGPLMCFMLWPGIFKLMLYLNKHNIEWLAKIREYCVFSDWLIMTAVIMGDSHFGSPKANFRSPWKVHVVSKKR